VDAPHDFKLVLCIPAFNEERSIARVMVQAKKAVNDILVCDDGSADMTGEIAAALGATVIRHERNLGKGAALNSLLEEAMRRGVDVAITMDADGQHDPDEILQVAKPVIEKRADISIGVRPLTPDVMPRERIVGNKLLSGITNRKAGTSVSDTHSGFRSYSAIALKAMTFRENRMAVESQSLIDAAKAGLVMAEVQVGTTYDGIPTRRNPIDHFAGVLDYLFRRTIAESPLLYLGLPGLIALVVGLASGLRALDIFVATHEIAIGTGLIAVTLIMIGIVMFATSLIIKIVSTQPKQHG